MKLNNTKFINDLQTMCNLDNTVYCLLQSLIRHSELLA